MVLKPESIEKLSRSGLTFIRPDPAASPSCRPVFISKIAAGFPSPADDYVEYAISNRYRRRTGRVRPHLAVS